MSFTGYNHIYMTSRENIINYVVVSCNFGFISNVNDTTVRLASDFNYLAHGN